MEDDVNKLTRHEHYINMTNILLIGKSYNLREVVVSSPVGQFTYLYRTNTGLIGLVGGGRVEGDNN